MKKVSLALGMVAMMATMGAATAEEVILPPPPPPMPAPDTTGWVRVAPIPDNPTVMGGVTSGSTSVTGQISPNGGNVTITMPLPGG